ncbi:MAG: VCBS repeat-containing protein, partial [Candidatus Cloacimonetes bacterium]|nr:VCBS repeat-containing protein [Candidatus Cloacimonadota bacterium]
ADVDNDGDLDLGSNSFGSGAGVHVYLNQGDGTWIQSFGFLGGNSSMDFMFGDINNDGFIDFAVNHQSGSVYFGDGTGDFELADNNLPPGGILGRCGISLGDIDNDGGKDLAYITSSGGIKAWLWDETSQQWIDISGNLPLSGDYEMTQLYDMNTDGFIDLAAFGEGTFTLWLGDGGSNWLQDAQFFTPSYGYCEAFRAGGDIDHNGYADLMLVADEGSWPSDHNHLRCFKENSPAYQLDISAVFPRGNEFFLPGSVQFIDWIAAVPAGDVATITLEYSLEGENGPWSSIATDLPNNGRFQWTIPEFSSSDCFLKYTATTPSASQFAITPCAFTIAAVTDSDDNIMPAAVIELRNCPNPFNPLTTITYSLPQETTVILKIHNIRGQLVRILVSGIKPAGEYQIIWNGKDYDDQPVPSGIYFYQLDTGIGSQIGKMILLR